MEGICIKSGGATKAANSGVGERVFQRHGRWKSVSAKDGYVKDNITSRISVSKDLSFEHPFFKPFLCLLLDYLLYSGARPKHAK